MRFVVATHSYLLLVEFDDELQPIDVRVLDENYYDGVDVMSDGTIIGCHKLDHWSKTSPSGFRFFDADGPISVPPLDGSDILDPHQITLSWDERALWCLSTASNEVVLKSLRNSDLDKRWLMPTPGGNWNHLNSVAIRDARHISIVFHNLARENSEVRIFNIDMALKWVQRLWHKSIHNHEEDDANNHYYNASDNGAVIRFKWGAKSYDKAAEIGQQWHPKGLCLTPDFVVCGYSEHAVSTPRRFVAESGLAFIDRASFELLTLSTILLTEAKFVGNINDIRYYCPSSARIQKTSSVPATPTSRSSSAKSSSISTAV